MLCTAPSLSSSSNCNVPQQLIFHAPNFSPSKRVHFKFRPSTISAATSTSERAQQSHSHTSQPSSSLSPSLYEVLGIQSAATCQDIKAAYRRLARVFHPDVRIANGQTCSAVEFMRVHQAYETLSDPDKRIVYDRTLRRRLVNKTNPTFTVEIVGSSASGFDWTYGRCRRWETDQCW